MASRSSHRAPSCRANRAASGGIVLGVTLVLAGLVVGAMLRREPEPRDRVVGGNVPVDPGAEVTTDVSAYNSPSLQANPRDTSDLVVAERVDTPFTTCALQVSIDAGATWTTVRIPFPEGKDVPCFSPDVAFGADGTAYLAFSTFAVVAGQGTVPDGLWLSTSTNGGRNFSPPHQVEGPIALQVGLVADPAIPKRLYLTWLQATHPSTWGLDSTGDPLVVARSDDGGTTWSRPVQASGAGRARVVAPSLAVSADGTLVMAYLDVGDDLLDYAGDDNGMGGDPYPKHWALVAARSVDGGSTWSESVVDSAIVPTQRFLMLVPPTPSVAVDRGRDRAYIAFHDGRLGDADVWLWTSADGGQRWGPAKRVNDTPVHDGTAQYLPAVAVAPDGRVDVVYYDRRDDPNDVMTEVSLQSSYDGGKTFGHSLEVSDRAFDSDVSPGSVRGMPDLGDRLGLVSVNVGVLAMWTDTRAGTRQNNKQDVARAVVVIPPTPPWRRVAHDAAPVVAALGALLAAAATLRWLLWRRRQREPAATPPSVPTGS